MSRGDFYDSLFGRVYSAYMDRPRLGRGIARMVWGSDSGQYYRSMSAIAEMPAGSTIVDCPCGAGPALRALSPSAALRYVAADLSPSMLQRIRRKADRLRIPAVEPLEADAASLPLPDGSADLFLSYWGMHVFADPRAAVGEIARVLRPGGRLVGAAFVNEPRGLRQRLLLRPGSADFGPMCREDELRDWLGDAGLRIDEAGRSGVFFFFDATLRDREADGGLAQPRSQAA